MNQADLMITRSSNLANWLVGSVNNSRGRVAYSSHISTITLHLKYFTSHCSRRKMFYNIECLKYISRSLSRGCLDYSDLWCSGFSPLIFRTEFDYYFPFWGLLGWRLACCQLFSRLVVKWVNFIEGRSPSILLVVLLGHFVIFT